MQLHTIAPNHPKKRGRRIGRGGKRGTYSGRGMKGQKARAGARIRPQIRDLIKRIPKLRGIGFARPKKPKPQIINIKDLEKHFISGEKITPEILHKKGLISTQGGRLPEVKLLGQGALTKKLLVASCQVSKGAKEKIEKAGGTIQ